MMKANKRSCFSKGETTGSNEEKKDLLAALLDEYLQGSNPSMGLKKQIIDILFER